MIQRYLIIIFNFLFGIMTFCLFTCHVVFAYSNITSVDTVQGLPIKMPFYYKNQKLNIYDKGALINLMEFLGDKTFLFWYPTINYTKTDGTQFDKNPGILIPNRTIDMSKVDLEELKIQALLNSSKYEILNWKQQNFHVKDYLPKEELNIINPFEE